MNCNRVLVWILKIFLFLVCASQLILYTMKTIDEYKLHKSNAIDKRVFLLNKTIYYTLSLICLTSGIFNGVIFLQSSSIGLFMIWYETHNKEPGLLWSDNVEEIVSYVLLISVVIISQLLAFTTKSRIEYVPYFPASKTSNEFSFKRKRTGSSGSYTRNMNGNNSDLMRNGFK